WPGEAGNKTKLYRIFVDKEDDGDRGGCRLDSEWRSGTAGRHNYSKSSPNQIGCQRREVVDLIFRPAGFEHHVLALGSPVFSQALSESDQTCGHPFKRCAVEESNYWHCRLLCVRGERPDDG